MATNLTLGSDGERNHRGRGKDRGNPLKERENFEKTLEEK